MCATFQAMARTCSKQMVRGFLIWNLTLRRMVDQYRRFRTTYRVPSSRLSSPDYLNLEEGTESVPKRRYGTIIVCCAKSQKSADLT
jgi:hypothetical protein